MSQTHSLLERVRKEPPHWSGDKIESWDENHFRKLEPFVSQDYWTDQGSVNVFRVVGTQHWDYQGKTWLNFLETGKRMDINIGLHTKNPGYYQETSRKKPMMYYLTLDGLSFFVGADGNHRTCIARFNFHESGQTQLHGVSVNHYHVDQEYYALYLKLRDVCRERTIPVNIQAYRETVRREDTAGWKMDFYNTFIRFDDMQTAESVILDKTAVEGKIKQMSSPARRRLFGFMRR